MGYKKGILHISAICGKSVFIGLPVENPHGPEGIPVYFLINELKEKMGDERCAFVAVLYAIDFGKGSIVADFRHDFYDRLEGTLNRIRESDEARKKQVFRALRNLLAKYENWADEDLDDFIAEIKVE